MVSIETVALSHRPREQPVVGHGATGVDGLLYGMAQSYKVPWCTTQVS